MLLKAKGALMTTGQKLGVDEGDRETENENNYIFWDSCKTVFETKIYSTEYIRKVPVTSEITLPTSRT